MREEPVNEAVGFDELRWLQEIARKDKQRVPELMSARLLRRGLIERTTAGFMVTARGRIALAKLG